MSRAFFTTFGKTCHVLLPLIWGKKRCEHLGTGGYAPAPIIPSLIAIAYVK